MLEVKTNECLSIQQTQTFNTICKNKNSSISSTLNGIVKKTNFEAMCRAFWIKINLMDYNNLTEFKILLNGHDRIIMNKKQMELICDKKLICNSHVLIFLNLEIGNNDWTLPQDWKQISCIYSNSLNGSRIDNFQFCFRFEKPFIHDDIQITSLSLNNLLLNSNTLTIKYF